MKKMFVRIAVMTLALIISAGYVMPETAFATDMKNPTATNVKYVTDNKGTKTGIKSFTIEPYTYVNLEPGKTVSLDDGQLREIAAKEIFPRWSYIADGVFRDQADQLVTIEGSGMMSSSKDAKNSFDKHFNTSKNGGYDSKWAISSLPEMLSSSEEKHQGEQCWDEMRATGITAIGSLSGARTLMGQELRNCSDDNDISVDEFLGNSYDKTKNERRLPALEDEKNGTGSGFASIVTSVNRAGASGDYDYVSLGLAVYDFELVPIAAKDLKYIEAASKTKDGDKILMGEMGDVDVSGIKFATTGSGVSHTYLKNTTPNKTKFASALKNTTTETNTVTHKETFQWSQTQHIGASVNMFVLGYSAGPNPPANPMLPRATLNFGFSWTELWSSTKGTAATRSDENERNVSSELELPPYTVAKITQNVDDKLTQEDYQQPVVLSYKVAIFAMSGDYYNGASGGITSSRYDKQWMSVIFDGSDAVEPNGNNALGSLYNRAIINKSTPGYDGAKGKLQSWCDKAAWNKKSKINWGNVAGDIAGNSKFDIKSSKTGEKSTLENLSTELPFLESASNLKSTKANMSSSLDQIVAYYPLTKVDLAKDGKVFNTKGHEKFYLDGIELQGLNKKDAEFYGFKKDWGEWKLWDAEKKEVIEDNETGDADSTKGQIKSGSFTLVNDEEIGSQYVKVDNQVENGDNVHLKWVVDPSDDTKIVCNDYLTDDDRPVSYMTEMEKEAVNTPVIRLEIMDLNQDVNSIKISGSYTGDYNKKINLGQKLTAHVLDYSGRSRGFPILWESNGAEGITVSENGDTEFSKPGTYKVRAFTFSDLQGYRIHSPWIEITVRKPAELDTIEIAKPDLDEDELVMTKKYPYKELDISKYVKFLDQYGDEYGSYYDSDEGWVSRELPSIEYSIDTDEGAYIDENGLLSVYSPGTYIISAKAYETDDEGNKNYLNYEIKPVKIKFTREDWLDYIELEEPSVKLSELVLQDGKDEVVIKDLASQLRYYDQDGQPWEGKKPVVFFEVNAESKYAKVKNGNLHIYEPGNYTLHALADGFDINTVNIQVTENNKLVIKTKDPSMLKITAQEPEPTINLENFVEYTTPFGSKSSGKNPELEFSLDSGVKGARIESRANIDEETGTDYGNYPALIVTEPGEYRVHVKVKKASEYSDDIDDIIVTADKYKTVKYVSLRFLEGDLELTVNTYDDNPLTDISLNDRLMYEDQNGEIDPKKERIAIPEVRYSFYGEETPSADEAVIKNGVLRVYKPGTYAVKVQPEKANVQGSVAVFEVKDITWIHNFGDWEPAYPAAPDACDQDTWVKKCQGHDTDGDGEIDEECDFTITKTLSAPGHRWSGEYIEEAGSSYTRDEIPADATIIEEEAAAEATTEEPESGVPEGSNEESAEGSTENAQEGAADNSEVKYKRAYIKCTVCGKEAESVSASVYYPEDCRIETVQPATCEANGTFEVKKEGNVIGGGDIPATGHYYAYSVIKEASCSEEGTEALKCTCEGCDYVLDDTEIIIPKTEHNPLGEPSRRIEPTCTEKGFEFYECRHCHKTIPGEEIEAKGHEWGAWKKLDAKQHQRICAHDGSHIEKANHTWDKGKVTKKPTTSAAGIRTYTCTACKATKTAKIAKLKKANPLKIAGKTATVKYSTLKKKAQTLSVGNVIKFTKKGQGKLTYAKVSGNKKITINNKTGKVTVKKGLKNGTYKVTVKVKAAGNANYKAATRKVSFKVRVK